MVEGLQSPLHKLKASKGFARKSVTYHERKSQHTKLFNSFGTGLSCIVAFAEVQTALRYTSPVAISVGRDPQPDDVFTYTI